MCKFSCYDCIHIEKNTPRCGNYMKCPDYLEWAREKNIPLEGDYWYAPKT